ncbi:MAG: hypothetical protein RLZZ303_1744 [Candidatus Hydrogenedentota bacterium]
MSEARAQDSPREWLDHLSFFGIKLGLENIRALLAADGNPQERLLTAHVAGTNGKGSTLAFLDALLRDAGYSTGRFTSPHLVRINERFLVNAMPIADADLDRHLEHFREIAARLGDLTPTYFEVCTAVALRHFAESGVDVALIETGMGGRLDSTNVVHPAAVAITSIGFDHMQYLGDTLTAIAGEKAGIIKPSAGAVAGAMPSEAASVIAAAAERAGARLRMQGTHFDARQAGPAWKPQLVYEDATLELGPVPLGLAGPHQAGNAAVAIELAMQLRQALPRLQPERHARALGDAGWPCRLERVCDSPPIIIDAAHNPDGMRVYAALFRRAVVVCACSSDKDTAGMLTHLARFAEPLIVTRYEGPRAADPHGLAEAMPGALAIPRLADAIAAGLERATPARPLLITGSIFLAGEARGHLEELGLAPPLAF